MKLTEHGKKIIDIIQWILILGLIGLTAFIYYHKKDLDDYNEAYRNELVYAKIYESQELETLKKRNRELHDSIVKIANAETAVEIRYIYKYNTDTITVDRFIQSPDSIYHFVNDNDTVRNEISVKASDLEWVTSSITIRDKFTIINAENDGHNYVEVSHSPNATIDGLDIWHRDDRKKWYDNFHVGPQVGVGYGIFNNQLDVYVGIGLSYSF